MGYVGIRRRPSNRPGPGDIGMLLLVAAMLVVMALWGAGGFTPTSPHLTSIQDPPAAVTNTLGGISCPAGQVAVLLPGADPQAGTWMCQDWPTVTPSTTTNGPTTLPPTTATTVPPTTTAPTTPVPTTSTSVATPTPTPSTTSVQVIKAYITGYSWFDNTPPGSAAISYPVLHQTAGGTGTYADPITLAVGHSIINGQDIPDWPVGTRFYIPNLRRYFLVEDSCGDGSKPQNGPCHVGYPSGASTWFDVWVGGQGGSSSGANSCMDGITDIHTVIVNPVAGYPVVSGSIYTSAGCTQQYGDSIPAHS